MSLQHVPYGGWKNCIRLANKEIELIATTDVGPRIIRFGFIGGANEFVEYPEHMGKTGGDTHHSYGGHRLWIAPEVQPRTYYPDNHPVSFREDENALHLQAPTETTTNIQKEINVWLDPSRNYVHVVHRLTNHGLWAVTLAAWALSVMAPGGRAIIPHEPYRPHPESVLPVRPLVLWSYTQMSDPRWTWGNRYIQLQQDANAKIPQKIGALNTPGWAAYTNGDRLFVKTFYSNPNEMYPDFGCNMEIFTNAKMLEVESLSPLATLEPGQSMTHEEHWYVYRGLTIGKTDDELDKIFLPLAKEIAR